MTTNTRRAVAPSQNPPPAVSQPTPPTPPPSLIQRLASRYQVDPGKLAATLKATVFKGQPRKDGTVREATDEELMSLLLIAERYGLDPFTREIYAFFDERRGGIVPIVSIDGWIRIINERPELEYITFAYHGFDVPRGSPECDPFIECTIKRSDRTLPLTAPEYMNECFRDTGPWRSHPRRMLRHKAMIQAARLAFGFAGIYDPDEGERIAAAIDVTPAKPAIASKPPTAAPRAIEQQAPQTLAVGHAMGIEPVQAGERHAAELRYRQETGSWPEQDGLPPLGDDDLAEMRRVDAEIAAREGGQA